MNKRWIAGACVLMIISGCASTKTDHTHQDGDHDAHAAATVTSAIAVVLPTANNTPHGVVRFEQGRGGVKVVADIHGLPPNSTHAWHVHEYGDISSSDGTATGGHYNPEGHMHALPGTAERHAGDLGNLTSDGSGHAHAELFVTNISIMGTRNPVVGRAIIIHAKADDGGQPTGNAGARIAQGVIGVAK